MAHRRKRDAHLAPSLWGRERELEGDPASTPAGEAFDGAAAAYGAHAFAHVDQAVRKFVGVAGLEAAAVVFDHDPEMRSGYRNLDAGDPGAGVLGDVVDRFLHRQKEVMPGLGGDSPVGNHVGGENLGAHAGLGKKGGGELADILHRFGDGVVPWIHRPNDLVERFHGVPRRRLDFL